MIEKVDVKSLNLKELEEFLISLGEKKFRAKQIYEWMHIHHVTSFDEMTNLSKNLRETLKEKADLIVLEEELVQISKIDGTRKYLFALADGNMIESVLMKYKHGNSVCVSSQVGCRMGCTFCASTQHGKVRDLRTSEILEQFYNTERANAVYGRGDVKGVYRVEKTVCKKRNSQYYNRNFHNCDDIVVVENSAGKK